MSDGLPTDEQLRRIERGVQRRIDRRREMAHRVTGTAAAVVLLGGGFALALPFALGHGSAGSASSAGGSAGSAAPAQAVLCHASSGVDSPTTRVEAAPGAPAEAIAAACGPAVEFQSGSGRMPTATSPAASAAAPGAVSPTSDRPSAGPPAVVCRAADGVLHVFPADRRPATLCTRNGMRPA